MRGKSQTQLRNSEQQGCIDSRGWERGCARSTTLVLGACVVILINWFLFAGGKAEMRNHYRGHKMSLWLNLIPQLHRPGEDDDVSMRHHHFQEEGAQYYDGKAAKTHIVPPCKNLCPNVAISLLHTRTLLVALPNEKGVILSISKWRCRIQYERNEMYHFEKNLKKLPPLSFITIANFRHELSDFLQSFHRRPYRFHRPP